MDTRELLEAVGASQSAKEIVDSLATALAPRVPYLLRVSIRRVVSDTELEIVAVWSATRTALKRGTRMSIMASSYPEASKAGGPVFLSSITARSVLDSLMKAEGIKSWVSIPLHKDGAVSGMLSISSAQKNAIQEENADAFRALGLAVERRLNDLGSL